MTWYLDPLSLKHTKQVLKSFQLNSATTAVMHCCYSAKMCKCPALTSFFQASLIFTG
jgi:hypothetical protein